MVDRTVSLISLSDSTLIMYRNEIDFCTLILHPVILPVSLMNTCSFLEVFFLHIVSCYLQIAIVFIFSFSIWIHFNVFFLSVGSKTSNNLFNESGQSKHACLVPDLRGNFLIFSPLSIMFVVELS